MYIVHVSQWVSQSVRVAYENRFYYNYGLESYFIRCLFDTSYSTHPPEAKPYNWTATSQVETIAPTSEGCWWSFLLHEAISSNEILLHHINVDLQTTRHRSLWQRLIKGGNFQPPFDMTHTHESISCHIKLIIFAIPSSMEKSKSSVSRSHTSHMYVFYVNMKCITVLNRKRRII